MEPSGNFILNMARAIDPLPTSGFRIRRGSGHVVTENLPRLLEFVTKKTSSKIESKLSRESVVLLKKRLLQKRLARITSERLTLATEGSAANNSSVDSINRPVFGASPAGKAAQKDK